MDYLVPISVKCVTSSLSPLVDDLVPNSVKFVNALKMPCYTQGISYFENSVDPDQLASEKPADQVPHYFLLCLELYIANNWNPAG